MKKALIAVGAVVMSFAMGVAGVYFAMPMLSPATAEGVQIHLDSLAVADSLASLGLADSLGFLPDGTIRPRDSLAVRLADSLADAGGAQDSTRSADELASGETPTAIEDSMAIQDSLVVLQQRVEGLLLGKRVLLEQIAELQMQLEAQLAQDDKIQQFISTLYKLEDRDLADVVAQLNAQVLEALYKQASGRNRARLLQAMRPEVAANFVNKLVQSGRAGVTPAPDTTSSKEAAGSESESLNKEG